MRTSLSIRLPKELAGRLEALADLLERPKTFVVRKALETYLEEYADYQIALERLHDQADEVISSALLRKRLGIRG